MTKQEFESRPYVIAIDFDGTLCENEWPGIGVPRWGVIRAAQEAKRKGAILVLWTCRSGTALNEALDACRNWGLVFDSVNENPKEMIELWGNDPRKVGADEYWDDKSRLIDSTCKELQITSTEILNALMGFFPGPPCDYCGMDAFADEWCEENCDNCLAKGYKECWIHAINYKWYERRLLE